MKQFIFSMLLFEFEVGLSGSLSTFDQQFASEIFDCDIGELFVETNASDVEGGIR